MDTFFARTDTLVSVALAALLPPGTYTIDLTLTDGPDDVAVAGEIPLIVGPAPTNAPGGADRPGLTPVGPGGGLGSLWFVTAGLAILLAFGLGAILYRRNRRRLRAVVT
jgi:hypothetical protein